MFGCIECGEDTNVIGIFTNKTIAEKVREDHEKRQEKNWTGQHYMFIYEINEIDKEYKVNYYSE